MPICSLRCLRRHLTPYTFILPYAVIEEELGRPVSELFAEISERPVAAASLGQVYKGRLHSGEEVAIKVRGMGGWKTS